MEVELYKLIVIQVNFDMNGIPLTWYLLDIICFGCMVLWIGLGVGVILFCIFPIWLKHCFYICCYSEWYVGDFGPCKVRLTRGET